MRKDNQKVSAFAEAVRLEIDHKIHQIEQEIEQYREQTIDAAYDQTYQRMFFAMQERVREIKAQELQGVTQAQLNCRRNLILHRNQLFDTLFESLRVRLQDFTKTPAYQPFLLQDLAGTCRDFFPYEQIEVRLRPADLPLADAIKTHLTAAFPEKIMTVQPDPSIQIGGFTLWSMAEQVLLNCTLETKMGEQQKQFRQTPLFRLDRF